MSSPVPPSNGSPSDHALERDDHPVALFGAFGFRGKRPVLLGDALQRLIDFGIGDLADETFELDGLEVRKRDRRHDLELDRVGEVGLAGDDALDGALLRGQRYLGLGRELEAAVGDDLVVGLADRRFDHLRHRGFAVDAPEMRDRHLAGAEAAELDAAFEIVEPFGDLALRDRSQGRRHGIRA